MTEQEMTRTAPNSYWRRRRYRAGRVVMLGAFIGLACGMLALVLQ